MLGFGIFGYILKMYGFEMGPIILGIILGPLIEGGISKSHDGCSTQHPRLLLGVGQKSP